MKDMYSFLFFRRKGESLEEETADDIVEKPDETDADDFEDPANTDWADTDETDDTDEEDETLE